MKRLILDDSGSFTAKGKIHDRYGKASLPELISFLLSEFGTIGESYQKYMINDRRLVGQEKVNLRELIDQLIQALLSLHDRMSKIASATGKPGFLLQLSDRYYTLTGSLADQFDRSGADFSEFYSVVLKNRLRELLSTIREALEDRKLEPEEASDILEGVESLVQASLVMFHKLEYHDIQR